MHDASKMIAFDLPNKQLKAVKDIRPLWKSMTGELWAVINEIRLIYKTLDWYV